MTRKTTRSSEINIVEATRRDLLAAQRALFDAISGFENAQRMHLEATKDELANALNEAFASFGVGG